MTIVLRHVLGTEKGVLYQGCSLLPPPFPNEVNFNFASERLGEATVSRGPGARLRDPTPKRSGLGVGPSWKIQRQRPCGETDVAVRDRGTFQRRPGAVNPR